MKTYSILVRKGKEHSEEGYRLRKLINNCTTEDITKQEDLVEKMRADVNNERSQRWRLGLNTPGLTRKGHLWMDQRKQ
eukprot:3052111-Heterocapsa_arctica.AAC.1